MTAQSGNDQASIQGVLDYALEQAQSQGVTAVAVKASISDGKSVTVRKGELDILEYHKGQSFSVTVYQGETKGSASTTDLTQKEIKTAIESAIGIARYTSEDPYSGLADKALLATSFPELDLYHPWSVDSSEMIEICKETEAKAIALDKRITNSEGASMSTYAGTSGYANSNGFSHLKEGSSHSYSCTLIAEDDNGMQRDYWYTGDRDKNQMQNFQDVANEAAKRALQRLSPQAIQSTTCPVLFSPDVARSLIGHLIGALSGSAQYKKNSFLLDAAGEAIFPEFVRIYEDPYIVAGAKSSSYDAEGVATKKSDLIHNGCIEHYVLSSYSGRKLKRPTTGNAGGLRNVRVESNGGDQSQLIKQMGSGVLVTELIGQGVNQITGDYSRGASGFLVKNGEIQYPVEGFTIAGNLKNMYQQLVAIGSDVDEQGNIHTGSWLLDNMTIAGQ